MLPTYLRPLTDLQYVPLFLQIWAGGCSSQRGTGDLVFTGEDSWGSGSHVTTTLYNDKNEVGVPPVSYTHLTLPTMAVV